MPPKKPDTRAIAMGTGIPEGDVEFSPASMVLDDETRRRRQQAKQMSSVDGREQQQQRRDRFDLEIAREAAAPPAIVEPKCRVCVSPHRVWIETMLMRGAAYVAIAESLPPDPYTGIEIERRSISNHYHKHMGYENAVVRGVLEEHANLIEQNVEEGVRGAFTQRGALDVLIRKAYDDALSGWTTVEPRDLIQMIKLYNDMDASSSVKLVEEAKASVAIFMAAIQNVMGELFEREQADDIKRAIVDEVKRLREQSEIESHIEHQLTRVV